MDGDAIDQLAEQLRTDPVVIDVAMGSGRADEYDDRLSAMVRELPFKTYVALVQQPSGLSEDASDELPALLHRRLQEPGLYVVQTSEGTLATEAFGIDLDSSVVAQAYYSSKDEVEDRLAADPDQYAWVEGVIAAEIAVRTALQAPPGQEGADLDASDLELPDGDIEDLAQRASDLQSAANWRQDLPDNGQVYDTQVQVGRSWLVGTTLGSAVFAIVLLLLRNLPLRRARTRVDLGRQRHHSSTRVGALAQALEDLDWRGLSDRDAADRAALARDAAEPLLSSDALVDLVGAQVLAETGLVDLEIAATGEGEPFRPCYLDPRHGASAGTMRWRLGQGDVQVPVCSGCERASDSGTPRKPMQRERHGEVRRPGNKPYFEGREVWARTGFGALTDELARDVLADRNGGKR